MTLLAWVLWIVQKLNDEINQSFLCAVFLNDIVDFVDAQIFALYDESLDKFHQRKDVSNILCLNQAYTSNEVFTLIYMMQSVSHNTWLAYTVEPKSYNHPCFFFHY